MYVYTPGQWALLFFFYCFCGWVWESCYVSAKQRHWVNRGFLHGPLLPIYGSGAIIILFATLPVADNFWLVYFLGMLAATALEYVVGAVMEQLFKVRYWDYTKQPFNLHGYICLTSSIAWGFFSDLLIYVIHPPIDKLLHKLPALLVNPLAAVIAVLFIMDTVKSTKAAIDLREVLTKLTEENAELRRLAKKAEAAQARTAEELQAFREKTSLDRYLLQSYLADELEAHRTAAPSAAFADLALNYGLDGIFAGDPEVSAREQEYIRHFCTIGELCLPVALRPGYEMLYDRTFTCRPDSPKGLVRYQESRLYSCFGNSVQPDNCVERRRRCVTMDNIGYGRYSGEIQLVRADLPADEKVNVIGEVPAEYDLLLDCIKRGKTFRMVKVS